MLIGIDASRAAYPQRTGTENYSLFLIRALLAQDTENHYRLYFSFPPKPGLFPAAPNAEIRTIPFPRLWTHARLSWEMAKRPPDVLFVPAHVLPLVHPRHCVVSVHDLGYLHYPQAHTRWGRWYLHWSTGHNARTASHIIADSQATKRDLTRNAQVPPGRITVVYPGHDPSFAPVREPARLNAVRERFGIPGRYALYVGTLQPRKNLGRLMGACAMLAREGDQVHLVIAGKKGWLHRSLFEHTRLLGLEQRVHFTGYVPQQELPALISGAAVFVLPSLYEGFGLPVLEAMACGTPVVCSNVSSLPEVAGDAAVLVNPLDTAGLARAIHRVMTDKDLRRDLAQKGLERVKGFSWEKAARQVSTILLSAAAT